MRKLFFITLFILFILISKSFSQQLVFNHILRAQNGGGFNSIAQDKYGVIWFTRYLEGLQRFDGWELKTYLHDPYNTNSVAIKDGDEFSVEVTTFVVVSTGSESSLSV